jgi:hypothetical protein
MDLCAAAGERPLFSTACPFRKTASEAELDAELNFHFDRQVEKNIRAGMTPAEAVREARMAFGGMSQVKEDCRRALGTALIKTLVQDIGYGARLLVRNPGFSTTALLTLTLGVGATTGILSLVDAVLLRPLPYRDSQRLLQIYEDHGGVGVGLTYDADTPGGYVDLKRQTLVFEDVAALDTGNVLTLAVPLPEGAIVYVPDKAAAGVLPESAPLSSVISVAGWCGHLLHGRERGGGECSID